MQVKKGDRIQLTGTVTHFEQATGGAFINVDGQSGDNFWIEPKALAKATILPRPLEVGDRVRWRGGAVHFEIAATDGTRAALRYGGGERALSENGSHVPLSDLTRIDGEAT